MKLTEIREKLDKNGLLKETCRDAARSFIRSNSNQFKVMLTLTLKQSWYDKNGLMKVSHYLTTEDIPVIYSRFEHKLNRLVWKSKYTRHQSERLDILKAWEDGFGTKRIHLHALIGNLPEYLTFNSFACLVKEAVNECYEMDSQYNGTLCDIDAVDYITKEVGKRDTDKIIW